VARLPFARGCSARAVLRSRRSNTTSRLTKEAQRPGLDHDPLDDFERPEGPRPALDDGDGEQPEDIDEFGEADEPDDLEEPDYLEAGDAPEGLDAFDGVDEPFGGDGEDLPDEALEELAAIEEAETRSVSDSADLDAARVALEAERAHSAALLGRYRAAVLAAEPELPPELVQGDSLEALEASLAAARATVSGVRRRLEEQAGQYGDGEGLRGFPAGAPPRASAPTSDLTAEEKIRYGLEQRARA
jgi:hypothetical protein